LHRSLLQTNISALDKNHENPDPQLQMLVVVVVIIIIIIIINNSTTTLPALRQHHRLFETELTKQCDVVLPISIHSVFAFP
jgi:hypothetical protein